MQLLIYASPFNVIGCNLQKEIRALNVDVHSTYCATLESLDKYLRQPIGVSPIVILIPSDHGELAALIGMRHLLRDMRLILILPMINDPAGTDANAHLLRPRFIGYADGDLSDVTAVIGKMCSQGLDRSLNRQFVQSVNA